MAKKEKLKKDFSNKVVIIMLVIVIITSVVSLGIYSSYLSKSGPKIPLDNKGTVSLTIEEPPVIPVPVYSGGKVGLTIVNKI